MLPAIGANPRRVRALPDLEEGAQGYVQGAGTGAWRVTCYAHVDGLAELVRNIRCSRTQGETEYVECVPLHNPSSLSVVFTPS